jgi:beta-glucanase (GH16 family)
MLVAGIAFAQKGKTPKAASQNAAPPDPWSLTFSDEFDRSELDLAKWVPHEPAARVRDEAPASIEVSGGQLHIVSRSLAGGTVTTFGIFSQIYGRFEIRCRIAAGKGMRSALRLMPLSLGLPSIDVFEADGGTPAKIFFGNHWGTEQTERSYGDSLPVPDLSAGFHVISVEWDRDRIAWLTDGKKRFECTSAASVPGV